MKFSCFLLHLALCLLSFTGSAQPTLAPTPARPLQVAFVIYPGAEALDLSGPLDVLIKANLLTNNAYRCYTVALTDSILATELGGLHLRPDYTFQTMPKPDIVVVPGAAPARIQQLIAQEHLIAQLRALAPHTPLMMSVCTGALLLGQAGALDGHRATTHYMMTDELARHPHITVVRGVRYVADGPVLTTAGITAGIDGALALVERVSGQEVANAVSRLMEYTRPTALHPRSPAAYKPASPSRQLGAAKPKAAPVSKPKVTTPATPAAALTSPHDPVCHMSIAPTVARRSTYQGKTYGFCSESCRRIFVAKPGQYVP